MMKFSEFHASHAKPQFEYLTGVGHTSVGGNDDHRCLYPIPMPVMADDHPDSV